MADLQRTVYPHKWSPVSRRSSAGQREFACQRPTFTRWRIPRLRLRTSNCSLLLIYLPRKEERLSRPGWLTYSGRFTHILYPSAAGRAQDSESSPVRDRRSTTVLCGWFLNVHLSTFLNLFVNVSNLCVRNDGLPNYCIDRIRPHLTYTSDDVGPTLNPNPQWTASDMVLTQTHAVQCGN